MVESPISWTVLAHLLRPQGRKGEILAELLTDFPERIAGREGLYLIAANAEPAAAKIRPAKVLSSWLPVGRNSGRIVVEIEGVQSISEAEALAGLDLAVQAEQRIQLEEDANYVSDLVGCGVYDGDLLVGTVTDVQFPSSADGMRLEEVPSLLQVRSAEGDEILIPFVKALLVSMDVSARRIVFKLPAGLLEINR